MKTLKISIGKTYNLGNYQSLRLDVGLETDEERTFYDISTEVEDRLLELERQHGVTLHP